MHLFDVGTAVYVAAIVGLWISLMRQADRLGFLKIKMNDPHVKSLHYRVVFDDSVDYDNAPSILSETDEFSVSLDGESLVFEMKNHYSSADEAMAIVDKYIQAWEILIGLEHGPGDLSFRFANAEIIDRKPSLTETNQITGNAQITLSACSLTADAVIHVSRAKFPSLPNKFKSSTDAETMYLRYKAYRNKRETLASMAYMCLKILETSAGDRKKAAKKYGISRAVLGELGTLCTYRGDESEARKPPTDGKFVPLSSKEKEWIIAVVKAMIRRAGEYAYDPNTNLQQLTMADFPDISTEKNS